MSNLSCFFVLGLFASNCCRGGLEASSSLICKFAYCALGGSGGEVSTSVVVVLLCSSVSIEAL